jgi:hypothetical protein
MERILRCSLRYRAWVPAGFFTTRRRLFAFAACGNADWAAPIPINQRAPATSSDRPVQSDLAQNCVRKVRAFLYMGEEFPFRSRNSISFINVSRWLRKKLSLCSYVGLRDAGAFLNKLLSRCWRTQPRNCRPRMRAKLNIYRRHLRKFCVAVCGRVAANCSRDFKRDPRITDSQPQVRS